ncbi:MAG TPA: hypothetical protein VMT59_05830 [Gaiellaceae bacterium]|nr:hypothetical protein [Gaiellaceae bacterium]
MSTYTVHQALRSPDEADRVSEWRYQQFLALGFDGEQAWTLAGSDADLHASRTLIGVGCSHPLAMRILT